MPSATRPQRPERCAAEACEIASIGSRCTLSRAEYREKGSGLDAQATIPVQNERAELLSFTPGR